MLGAIIGDLAAWTYAHDKHKFYSELVSADSRLSEVGLAILGMFDVTQTMCHDAEWNEIANRLSLFLPLFESLCNNQQRNIIPQQTKRLMNVATDIVCGWMQHPEDSARDWGDRFHGCKEEYYLTQVSGIISRLWQGQTKKEAIHDTNCIVNWHMTHEQDDYWENTNYGGVSPLSYASLAWDCFKQSWDFTSAIHNAMKCPTGDKHMLGALTGAFAEAMYGCQYNLLKLKFVPADKSCTAINLPSDVEREYYNLFADIRRQESSTRTFIPKNCAWTNVELHKWSDVSNPWQQTVISADVRKSLLNTHPDSDQKYGLYLDDGWMYCYRSQKLLYRFKLIKQSDDTWRLSYLQESEEKITSDDSSLIEIISINCNNSMI